MTLHQVYIVGLLGGLSAVVGLVLFAGLAVGVYCAVSRLADRYEDFKARRRDLKACREIARLGTTSHPIDQ
ncbi:hypothetical protein ABZU94_10655 [Streptomyces mirabilis]|uniref:hypothetical protein n=1 Tax=Streptomyces sp. NPDC005388 TaxID=3156717 RepID=UPI0033B473CF